MLSCREVALRADAYLDSELGAWKGLQILLHLKLCKSCQRFMKQMEYTRSLIEHVNYGEEMSAPDVRITGLLRELSDRRNE